jgi:hypothetical protein
MNVIGFFPRQLAIDTLLTSGFGLEHKTYKDWCPPQWQFHLHGAAQLLGLNSSTLWSRIKKLGIELPKEVPAQTPC